MSTLFGTKDQRRVTSPYPALQAMLPRLAALNPEHETRPIFDRRDKAEVFIQLAREKSRDLFLNAVWAINHNDLKSSKIQAWSYTEYPC